MKKLTITFLLTVFLFTSLPLTAQEESPVKLRTSVGGALSIGSLLVSPDAAVIYRPGLLGAGAGLKAYAGLLYGDAYLIPYVTAELGWFSADLGYSIQIVPSDDQAVDLEGESPVYMSAAFFPAIPVGDGHLTFGASFDFAITASPVIEGDDPAASVLGTIIVAIFSLFKAEAAVGYRMTL